MSNERKPVITVSEDEHGRFEDICDQLYADGYRLDSSSCGIVNSESYGFCTYLEAIFVDTKLTT